MQPSCTSNPNKESFFNLLERGMDSMNGSINLNNIKVLTDRVERVKIVKQKSDNRGYTLKTHRNALGRLTAWQLLQIILCPQGKAKALTALALLYEHAVFCSTQLLLIILRQMPSMMTDHPFVNSRLAFLKCSRTWVREVCNVLWGHNSILSSYYGPYKPLETTAHAVRCDRSADLDKSQLEIAEL